MNNAKVLPLIKDSNMEMVKHAITPYEDNFLNDDFTEGQRYVSFGIPFGEMIMSFSMIVLQVAGQFMNESGVEDPTFTEIMQMFINVNPSNGKLFLMNARLFSAIERFSSWWLCQKAVTDDLNKAWCGNTAIIGLFNEWVKDHQGETSTNAYDKAAAELGVCGQEK